MIPLPPININIDPKYLAGGAGVLLACALLVYVGYTIGAQPDTSICEVYTSELKEANRQIKALEKKLHSIEEETLVSCIDREELICAEKIKATVDKVKALRCKICEAGGVR